MAEVEILGGSNAESTTEESTTENNQENSEESQTQDSAERESGGQEPEQTGEPGTQSEDNQTEESGGEKTESENNEEDKNADNNTEGKEYFLKIDGKEIKFTEEQLIQQAQKSAGADKAFSEASEMRGQVEEVLTALKERPFEILSNMGMDVKTLIEKHYLDQLNYEQLPEEQKQIINKEKLLKDREEKINNREKTIEQQELERETQKAQVEYRKAFTEAIVKNKLPNNEQTIRRFSFYALEGNKQGINLTTDQISKLVKDDYSKELKELLTTYKPEEIEAEFGKDFINNIRKYDVEKVKTKQTQKPRNGLIGTPGPKKPKMRTMAEFKEYMNNIKGDS